jgi:hypothetical protein
MLLDVAVGFALGVPIGWQREHTDFGPGLRNFPYVIAGM